MVANHKRRAAAFMAAVAAALLVACGGGGGGGGTGGDTPAPTPPPVVPPARSSVGLVAVGPTEPLAGGETATITLTISNTGPVTATGLVLTPNLASGLTLTGFGCTGALGGRCSYPTSLKATSLALPNLPSKASLTVVLKAQLPFNVSGTLTSTPAVQAANDDSAADNQASAAVQAFAADIVVSGSGPSAPLAAGATAHYTMTVSNAGPDAARRLQVVTRLGEQDDNNLQSQTPASLSCSASGGAICPALLGAHYTHVPLLPKNGSLVFSLATTLRPDVSGNVLTRMGVDVPGDTQPDNNRVSFQFPAYLPAQAAQPGQSLVTLQSEIGDFIGGGRSYRYTAGNARLAVQASGGSLQLEVTGDERWRAEFVLPAGITQIQPGSYTGLKRPPFHDAAVGGLSWVGEARGCNQVAGSFTVNSAAYTAGQLSAVDLSFEQFCDGKSAPLRGQVRWFASDTTAAPGPLNPPPAGLWAAPVGATPATGNFFYVQDEPWVWPGSGGSHVYTPADAVMRVTANGPRISVRVDGRESWSGELQGMEGQATLQPGYYGQVRRSASANPVRGGMDWGPCNALLGWFAIDKVTYTDGVLTALDARFEQHCDAGGARRGQIRWDASDRTAPPGPADPPAGLWAPGPGALPASGSHVHLESGFNDFAGGETRSTYTQANAVLGVSLSGRKLRVDVKGDETWTGEFEGMNSIADLRPGYYGSLSTWPFNPTRGGLDWWGGQGRNCDPSGWFVIDSLTRVNDTLTALTLRFEQRCSDGRLALRGVVHWDASDRSTAPGPVAVPANLWAPDAAATPAGGRYIVLASDADEFVGDGRTHAYTPANATLSVTGSGRRISVTVNGAQTWRSEFEGMNSISELQPGYYAGVQRHPFHNPAKGGLDWSGEGRGCNKSAGWFAIDRISFVNDELTSLILRFEQRCDGGVLALRGKIHWVP